MNILVTGANGQLGNEMRIVAKDSCDNYIFSDIIASDGNDTSILDITDIDSVREIVKSKNIDCIVNCAAYTNVDKAEDDYTVAEEINAKAPLNLAISMAEVGGLLIHISTDYVFGEEKYNTPCKEDQIGTPTGVYGATKLQGEQNILSTNCHYVIIRTSWLYSEFGKNFVKTMLCLTAKKPQINVVFDQVGTPTYALDLATVITKIIKIYQEGKDIDGIYHFSNEGVCSWYDFTKAIAAFSGHTNCVIRPCHSNEFPSPVKRPAYSVLDKTKIKTVLGIDIPYWVESLKACLQNMGELK